MNSNTIRNVMGVHRETGSLSVNSPPILDHLSRRKSIAYTDTTISDLIRNALWIGTVESVKEGSSVDSLTSAIALWVTATIVPKVREEVIKESELEVQEALENVKNEMNSVKEANREIMGRGSPEECKELFIKRMERTRIRFEIGHSHRGHLHQCVCIDAPAGTHAWQNARLLLPPPFCR